MSGGLYTGFESYRVPSPGDIEKALKEGMLALDANVLLNLYRYNEQTVSDLLSVAEAAGQRLFIPHQIVREFWRNRQSVIASRGTAFKDTQGALGKNETSTTDAISRWAKSVALPEDQRQSLTAKVATFYEQLRESVVDQPAQVNTHAPTDDDALLGKIEKLLDDCVGSALSDDDWKDAVEEGARRVENSIPPGYMDVDKLESDLEEGASGDYLIWHQLLLEAAERKIDLVMVTTDTKEDWWNRAARGSAIGPRQELVDEYLNTAESRFFLLEPADLLKHSDALGVGTSEASMQDVERVRDEEPDWTPWTEEATQAVLRRLDSGGYAQAEVIREAINDGGRVSRARVYELDNRDPEQMLRGFTKPVRRITSELQADDVIPYGVRPLLGAVYESGVEASHFAVPPEVVELVPGS